MTIAEFLSDLRKLDVRLWVEDDRLRYRAPAGVLTPALRADIAERKAEIIMFLGRAEDDGGQEKIGRPALDDEAVPLSYDQQQKWTQALYGPGDIGFKLSRRNHLHWIRFKKPLDVSAVELSLNEIVRRHEVLRTTFLRVGDEFTQRVAPYSAFELQRVDLRALPETEREDEAQRLANGLSRIPFDMSGGRLLRPALIHLGERDHLLTVLVNLLVFDQWSVRIFVRELETLYEAFAAGEPSPLPELPFQYSDYAHWLRGYVKQDDQESGLAFWRQQLAGVPLFNIPVDHSRRKIESTNSGGESKIVLSPNPPKEGVGLAS